VRQLAAPQARRSRRGSARAYAALSQGSVASGEGASPVPRHSAVRGLRGRRHGAEKHGGPSADRGRHLDDVCATKERYTLPRLRVVGVVVVVFSGRKHTQEKFGKKKKRRTEFFTRIALPSGRGSVGDVSLYLSPSLQRGAGSCVCDTERSRTLERGGRGKILSPK
jgi:hypothetical protein